MEKSSTTSTKRKSDVNDSNLLSKKIFKKSNDDDDGDSESFLAEFQRFVDDRDDSKFRFDDILRTNLHLSYCENFLPRSVADSLLKFCERTIRYPEGTKLRVFGKWHAIPRKQAAFGDDGIFYEFSGTKVAAEKWPMEIQELKNHVSRMVGQEFNFVLVNRYADGNDHIGEHRDDEKELDPNSSIASVSIGQTRDFVFRHESKVRKSLKLDTRAAIQNSSPDNVRLQLRHGSLLLMRQPTNSHWYHSLPTRKNAPGVRINFTFRKVIKVIK